MAYRSRLEIIVDVLESALAGNKRTRIMYYAYLSFPQLKFFLKYLTELGVLEKVGGEEDEEVYKTTEKGRILLQSYSTIEEILGVKRQKRATISN